MAMSMQDLVDEARSRVTAVPPQAARQGQTSGDLILDVREPAELEKEGCIEGAVHIPMGVLESRADPASPAADARLNHIRGDGRVHVLCASGARAAMAADTLGRMGYAATFIEGGLSGWKSAGLPVQSSSDART